MVRPTGEGHAWYAPQERVVHGTPHMQVQCVVECARDMRRNHTNVLSYPWSHRMYMQHRTVKLTLASGPLFGPAAVCVLFLHSPSLKLTGSRSLTDR